MLKTKLDGAKEPCFYNFIKIEIYKIYYIHHAKVVIKMFEYNTKY